MTTRSMAVVMMVTIGMLVASASSAQAADATAVCEKSKLKAAGKRDLCLAKEAGKAQLGKPTDTAKCETKFSEALTRADEQAAKKGAACRYVDNGNGTVSDLDTGLTWQQTDDAGGLTDKDNIYTWTDGGDGDDTNPDGTLYTEFLAGLNACMSSDGVSIVGGHAGYCDWRVPTIVELATLIDASACPIGGPCIDPIFDPTAGGQYWSSTALSTFPDNAWYVDFVTTLVNANLHMSNAHSARAVRGAP